MSVFFRNIIKSRSILLFILVCFSANMTVSAAMVSTLQMTGPQLTDQNSIVDIANIRVELEQQLISLGVAAEQVETRLNSMTDVEIATVSSEISDLPAGGDALTIIALVFLVLLFTDIAGYTDLFPFVKKTSKHRGNADHGGAVIDRRNNRRRKEPIVIEN